MKKNVAVAAAVATVAFGLTQSTRAQTQAGLDTAAIEQGTGLKGQLIAEESVFKVTKPRTDVKIQVDQWTMPPFMGLSSWAAFAPAHIGSQVAMMGDTVVFEDEVNPVMSAAFEAGLEVTALHNHFFFDEPKVYFMHIGGHGETKALATGVKKVDDKISRDSPPTPRRSNPFRAKSHLQVDHRAPLEAALGMKGQAKQGMFKVVIGRTATMQASRWQGDGRQHLGGVRGQHEAAVVDGDFAMRKPSSNRSCAPCEGRHQHRRHSPTYEHEQPRYFFLHYWGKGKAVDLAQSFKRVLDVQAAAKS